MLIELLWMSECAVAASNETVSVEDGLQSLASCQHHLFTLNYGECLLLSDCFSCLMTIAC